MLRDRIVLEHLPLVRAIAIRVHDSLPLHVDVEDLINAGVLGLFDAASKYDPDRKVFFAAYAKHRIRGAILDSLRELDWATREMRRRSRQVDVATRELMTELQRTPTEEELAARLGVQVDRCRRMLAQMHTLGLVSADTRAQDSDDLPMPEFAGGAESRPDYVCARTQMRTALDQAMTVLPDRYRQVVDLYYRSELTMKEIGGMLGINESRVSQIHKSALEKMNVALQGAGISSSAAF